MGKVGAGFMDYVNAAKEKLGLGPKPVETTIEQAVPSLPSGTDLGMASEPTGYTSAGGRRHKRSKKTRKSKKGGRRTRRR
jgi:hypothetical protein